MPCLQGRNHNWKQVVETKACSVCDGDDYYYENDYDDEEYYNNYGRWRRKLVQPCDAKGCDGGRVVVKEYWECTRCGKTY
jgi:hypothetical protein